MKIFFPEHLACLVLFVVTRQFEMLAIGESVMHLVPL